MNACDTNVEQVCAFGLDLGGESGETGEAGEGEMPFATVTFHSYFDSIERVSTTDAWGE